ncbi:APC family permease [Streptomyces himalayensis]|uniref:Amino acid permease n=1 Tax=Streptomyces himalayensis subsp. himalayensis TaxID=2756131 RepID=A0A7W0I975_9ACTN|nr:amino acid permease [Streptomyces himalayensis]MBA2946744.1 amino acid permease [Streptomyces himalayensis subsp. himalayensis]
MTTEQLEHSTGQLKKEFTLRSAFTIAFVFISPIVALYGVFALVLTSAGPAGWWAFVIVLVGQLFVAGVFAQLASKWPLEGSVYQWSRLLGGEYYGWFAGWAYMWSLMTAVAGGSYYVASFLPVILGTEPFGQTTKILVAIAVTAAVTALNAAGPKAVKAFAVLSLLAEVVGSIVLGVVLIISHRNQPFSVIFDTAGTGGADGGNWLWMGLFAAVGFVGWAFVGFESAGAIAEEVVDAERNVPKAMVASLIAIGAVVLFSGLALILATPDMQAVVTGAVQDPTAETAQAAMGNSITKPLFVLIVIGFMASALAAQTSASRIIWSFARDGVLPASGRLSKLSRRGLNPLTAILTAGAISMLVLCVGVSAKFYNTLVSFSTGGFFVAFAMPVLGVLMHRLRGRWIPGRVTLGRWGYLVTVVAALWVAFELVNIVWPRSPQLAWYENYAVLLAMAVVALLGLFLWYQVRDKVARLADSSPPTALLPTASDGL